MNEVKALTTEEANALEMIGRFGEPTRIQVTDTVTALLTAGLIEMRRSSEHGDLHQISRAGIEWLCSVGRWPEGGAMRRMSRTPKFRPVFVG